MKSQAKYIEDKVEEDEKPSKTFQLYNDKAVKEKLKKKKEEEKEANEKEEKGEKEEKEGKSEKVEKSKDNASLSPSSKVDNDYKEEFEKI